MKRKDPQWEPTVWTLWLSSITCESGLSHRPPNRLRCLAHPHHIYSKCLSNHTAIEPVFLRRISWTVTGTPCLDRFLFLVVTDLSEECCHGVSCRVYMELWAQNKRLGHHPLICYPRFWSLVFHIFSVTILAFCMKKWPKKMELKIQYKVDEPHPDWTAQL